MTKTDGSVPVDGQRDTETLELLTDDGDVWTAVPVDASGDERTTRWLSVETDALCELSAWR